MFNARMHRHLFVAKQNKIFIKTKIKKYIKLQCEIFSAFVTKTI